MTLRQAMCSYQGRMNRSDFWIKGWLPLLPVAIVANILMFGFPNNTTADIIASLLCGVSVFPGVALVLKRLHDRNHAGWWFFAVGIIPVIGIIWFLVEVGCLRGTVGANRFGNDPLDGEYSSNNTADGVRQPADGSPKPSM